MRIGVTLENDRGMDGDVCMHFGQCSHFLIADVKDGKITKSVIVPNTARHGGGGCKAVDEILKHGITHIISGGMGGNAQQKLKQAKVEIFGYTGKVIDGINKLIENSLSGIDACKDHRRDCK